ncbi:hypothetical protein BVRB_031290 [Beta vulgaris subsp. vulgaris]|uniref:Uncharacterized protein n=1 Tax=Beta vulgaris subsp. vulgaris TaxID=3555 RepID=A0A0J8B0M7_BETVV|nr:hypothetical protein BVRB_031290 [Beta vulgaris subsp. vulgaris]
MLFILVDEICEDRGGVRDGTQIAWQIDEIMAHIQNPQRLHADHLAGRYSTDPVALQVELDQTHFADPFGDASQRVVAQIESLYGPEAADPVRDRDQVVMGQHNAGYGSTAAQKIQRQRA